VLGRTLGRPENCLEKRLPGSHSEPFSGPDWRGTPGRNQNRHEKGSQVAILNEFQGLAGGEPRKSQKQSRKKLPGSHSEPFSGPGWGGPWEEPKTVTKKAPGEPF